MARLAAARQVRKIKRTKSVMQNQTPDMRTNMSRTGKE
jgi:hypothetical protein